MKRSYFKTKPFSEQKPMRRTPLARKSSRKPTKTNRARKMMIKREMILQYDLPNVECRRWGTGKGATRTDILRGILWNIFSRYIRQRDEGICISCNHPKIFEELQAGHYAPVGDTSVELWFDEKNVNGECNYCNAFDLFHLVPMRVNLTKKYGDSAVIEIERIKAMKSTVKWEESDYVQRIHYYQDKLKQYERNN